MTLRTRGNILLGKRVLTRELFAGHEMAYCLSYVGRRYFIPIFYLIIFMWTNKYVTNEMYPDHV